MDVDKKTKILIKGLSILTIIALVILISAQAIYYAGYYKGSKLREKLNQEWQRAEQVDVTYSTLD